MNHSGKCLIWRAKQITFAKSTKILHSKLSPAELQRVTFQLSNRSQRLRNGRNHHFINQFTLTHFCLIIKSSTNFRSLWRSYLVTDYWILNLIYHFIPPVSYWYLTCNQINFHQSMEITYTERLITEKLLPLTSSLENCCSPNSVWVSVFMICKSLIWFNK